MKQKLKYQDVEYDIVFLDGTDVITTSDPDGDVGNNGGNMDQDAWE